MDEYPDPEDEYDLVHQDEYDALRELDEELQVPDYIAKKSRQSLNFDESVNKSPVVPTNKTTASKRNSLELDDEPIAIPPSKRRKTSSNVTQESKEDFELGVSILDPPITPSVAKSAPSFNIYGVTSLRFPTWNFLTLNTDFGERLFVRLRAPNNSNVDFVDNLTKNNHASESFKRLKQKVLKQIENNEEISKKVELNSEASGPVETSELWVEQFKPKRYMELLSDEGVNRALLCWVKTWDKIVFNRERVKKPEPEKPGKPQFKGKLQIQEEKASELDADGRPQHKVALLCGPPGIGKTTLAHVIATVAGYNVIEVNASDDRSIESFRTTLQNATEMQSVMGSRKPNCLILDEIDGAPSASIDFLIKFINGKVVEQVKKGKKEKNVKIVRRPVICICNEPYTPSLRQLRQQAYVLYFPHTSSTKLAQRLLEICRTQRMKTDLSTLALLCDKAQSDIRSCITTLHFFKTKHRNAFRSGDVAKASVGLKDMQKNLFTTWQEIFQKPTKKSLNKGFASSNGSKVEDFCAYHPDNMRRLQHIVQLLYSAGDHEKLQQGVYENMLKIQFPWFQQSLLKGLEWFCWSDLLDTSIRHGQNFVLMPYLPYAFASWHFLFSTTAWPKITYPSIGYENHLKATKYSQIMADVMRGLNPTLRAHSQRSHMLLDVLPLLPRILAPSLRPVNATLFNDREKAEFANLVNVLLDFNVNYVQQRVPDGSYVYTIDPNFEEVTHLPLKDRPKIHELSYNIKQMVAREVELERVRRSEQFSTMDATQSAPAKGSASSTVPSHLQKLKPKPLPTINETVQYKDFFGRVIQVERSNGPRYGLDKSNYVKSRVWFSFKEGFNNAVKKDLTIADLL